MIKLIQKYLSILSLFLVISIPTYANETTAITKVMNEKVNSILVILKDEKLLRCEQDTKIAEISKGLFDYTLMSRLSVGKKLWKKATKEQKKEFAHFFELRMKKSFIDKAHLLSDEKVTVNTAEQVKPTRIHLSVLIEGKEENTDIVYKYYHAKNGEWLIYDINIAGISILKTYRAQFAEVLDGGDMEELIKQLKPKKLS